MEFRYKLMGWDEKKVIDSKIFDVQDLAEQCIYIDGLYDLQWMLKEWAGDFSMYTDIDADIKKCEKAVLEKCWDSSTKNFYSLRNGQEHLKTLTIANLFPILIKNLDQDKVNAIVSALEDKKKFNTPYPVPSVAVDEFTFDPDSIAPIWRGPTWMNTNWFLIRGLTRNGVYDTAQKIIHKSVEMVQENGFMEFYHPYTGKGMRTKNFGWSTLAITFSGYYEH
jgi:glycogen debranching enzyme